ncbi:MAG: hypothetical protein A3C71_02225 [Candidatus Yanofskybacteria bacterium RIFCSPHIGHO2_02_FULL_43_15c]|uniref:Uncharacterized protein n=2 Tax=Candidatus Yanofskyibacteriota TaxID=1752733 RepID=A0A1F8H4N4_9BACT|nr:MAG: hypothetical protein A3C71_02225 [Candidatus Yanofskybacteria bacterium RIFCSPHIGHO2_02_FULL_43_15c]OGN32555.1 MAG: hypothetical protein A3I92_01150 [Candidatus Yanofskybacteria bacterium RIFCSPLOWO2_02_FULL_43_10b]
MFDGEIKYGGILYNNRSQILIESFKNLMKQLYSYEPRIYLNKKSGVIRLGYFNVELGPIFKSKAVELVREITTFPLNFQRVFLQAFFNDEGGIYFNGSKRRVKGYQYNNKILFLVQKLLMNFEIESVVDTRFHEIIIGRRKNLEKFAEEINFASGLCVNGERSNSIWKKSLEKRVILNMALKSYLV